jgi:hypothetical protein
MRSNRINEAIIYRHNPDYLFVQCLDTSIVEQSCGAKAESPVNHGPAEVKL